MDPLTPFERQVAAELRAMVGSSVRFDPFDIARAAAATPVASTWRLSALLRTGGMAFAATSVLLAGLVALGLIASDRLEPRTGRELFVAADGSGQFANIAAAVDVARDGDVIVVYPGTYEESLLITHDIELRGGGADPSDVVLRIPAGGPAMRLQDADVVVGGMTFLSVGSGDESAARRPAIDVVGGRPVLEDLAARADEPVAFTFVRLAATERGTIIRDSVSSGGVRANRGAHLSIEDSVLRRASPEAPAVGVALARWDTYGRIVGSELNYVDVYAASAHIIDNDIAGALPRVPSSDATSSFREGVCGVSALLGRSVLVDNRIHGNQTGVCGQAEIDGGQIFDNHVGIWSGRYWGHGQLMGESLMHVEHTSISGNDVGVRGAPMSATVLHDVTICANGLATDAGASATVERSGATSCR